MQQESPRIIFALRCFLTNKNGYILLVKRSSDEEYAPDLWEVPGGKLETDQTLEDALQKEIKEETGLSVEITSPFPYVENNMSNVPYYSGHLYIAHFYLAKIVGGEICLSAEHEGFAWVTYSELLTYNLTPDTKKAATRFHEFFPKQVLGWEQGKKKIITIDEIQDLISEHYDLSLRELTSKGKSRRLTYPRQLAIWLSRELTSCTNTEIGHKFGDRDHATVNHSLMRIKNLLQTDETLKETCKSLLEKLRDR